MFDRQQSIIEAEEVNLASDTTFPSNKPTRAIFVGTTGNIVVEFAHKPGVWVTYTNITVGRHVMRLSKIRSTSNGTTANNIVAEF